MQIENNIRDIYPFVGDLIKNNEYEVTYVCPACKCIHKHFNKNEYDQLYDFIKLNIGLLERVFVRCHSCNVVFRINKEVKL